MFYSGCAPGGALIPVKKEPGLATYKQPVRDSTKRWSILFMEFLLYLLVVVASDAFTSACVTISLAYGQRSSCLEALMRWAYVFTSASNKARKT